MNARLRV